MTAEDRSTVENLLQHGIELFRDEFQTDPTVAGCAPGRVNLIGEHTDYNSGFVLPMALPLVTLLIGKKNGLQVCRIVTSSPNVDEPHRVTFSVPKEPSDLQPGLPKWANYVKGVVAYFHAAVVGFDAAIVTNVPVGSGLSSSASLAVATYSLLEAVTEQQTDDLKSKALTCKKSENEFAKTPCGIMDQFISVLGKEQNALLIDCRNFECIYVPVKDEEHVFLITDSNVHHELSGGEYSARRSSCFEVAEVLNKSSLREASISEIENLFEQKKINEIQFKRARHVITEIDRTVKAVEALRREEYNTFGRLMYLSHHSLRDDYEVSCEELDQLVSIASEIPGVLGSRMTGGGFGGCTVTLVKKASVNHLIEEIKKNYVGSAKFYVGVPSAGARIIKLN